MATTSPTNVTGTNVQLDVVGNLNVHPDPSGNGGTISATYASNGNGVGGAIRSTPVVTKAAGSAYANSTVPTQLIGVTVPANSITAGTTYKVISFGTFATTSTPTLAFGVYHGASAIATTPTFTTASSVSGMPYYVEATVQAYGTATMVGSVKLNVGTSSTTDVYTGVVSVGGGTSGTTIGSGTAASLGVFATWSAASASNTLQPLGGYVEEIA